MSIINIGMYGGEHLGERLYIGQIENSDSIWLQREHRIAVIENSYMGQVKWETVNTIEFPKSFNFAKSYYFNEITKDCWDEFYLNFIKRMSSLSSKNFCQFIPFICGFEEFKFKVPSNTLVFLSEYDSKHYKIVSSTDDSYYLKDEYDEDERECSKEEVENAVFSKWQIRKQKYIN